MSDGASNGTTTTTPTNGATPIVDTGSETLTRAQLDLAIAQLTGKLGGEIASLRKKMKGSAAVEVPEKKDETREPSTAPTVDWKTFREMGRLEAQLGDEAVAALGAEFDALPPAQQLLVLRAASKLRGATPKVETTEESGDHGAEDKGSGAEAEKPGRDARPKPSNPRGEAPRTRDAAPYPKSKREFQELKKSNPKQAEALIRDEKFDLNALPW